MANLDPQQGEQVDLSLDELLSLAAPDPQAFSQQDIQQAEQIDPDLDELLALAGTGEQQELPAAGGELVRAVARGTEQAAAVAVGGTLQAVGAQMKQFLNLQEKIRGKIDTFVQEKLGSPVLREVAEEVKPFFSDTEVRRGIATTLENVGTDLRRKLVQESLEGWEAPSPSLNEATWRDAWLPKSAAAVGQAVPTYVAAIGSLVATKNPRVAASLLGGFAGMNTYVSARDSGVGHSESTLYGMLNGAWSTVTEKIPFDKMLGAAGKGVLRRMATGATSESIQELIQNVGENLIEKFGFDEGRKLFEGWQDALVAGGILGAGAGAVIGGGPKANVTLSDVGNAKEAQLVNEGSEAAIQETTPVQGAETLKSIVNAAQLNENIALQPNPNPPIGPPPQGTGPGDVRSSNKGPVRRGFVESVENAELTDTRTAELVEGTYNPKKVQETLETAQGIIDTVGVNVAKDRILQQENFQDVDFAIAQDLMRRLQNDSRLEETVSIVEHVAAKATQMGQAIQALSLWGRLTPEGALKFATQILKRARTGPRGHTLPKTIGGKQAQKIIEASKAVGKAKTAKQRLVKIAELVDAQTEQIPTPTLKKIATFQAMAQLMAPKTAIRNIVGNSFMLPGRLISDVVAAPVDVIVTNFRKALKATGKTFNVDALSNISTDRTVVVPRIVPTLEGLVEPLKDFQEGWQAEDAAGLKDRFNQGMKTMLTMASLTGKGSKYDLDTMSNIFRTTFEGRLGKAMENLLKVELSVADRAFYKAAFFSSMDNQMRTAELNGVNLLSPTPEIIETANLDALKSVFQDDSLSAKTLKNLKTVLNFGKDFGIGDFIIKYPGVPGNLIARGTDFSHFGFLKTLFGAVGDSVKTGKVDQRKFVKGFSDALVGTTGLVGLGYFLASRGIVTGLPDDDFEIEMLRKQAGWGGLRMNVSALKRAITSFSWDKVQLEADGLPPENDTIWNFDWAQPLAFPLAMGAQLFQNKPQVARDLKSKSLPEDPTMFALAASDDFNSVDDEDKRIGQSMWKMLRSMYSFEAVSAGAKTIEQMSVLQGVRRASNALTYGSGRGKSGVISVIESVVVDAAKSFTPQIINQVGQFLSNQSRETGSPDNFERALNGVKSRLPIIKDQLPPRITTLGDEQEIYDDDGNSFYNVFINPAFVSKIKRDPEISEILRVYEETGERRVAPRKVRKKIQITQPDGSKVKRELTTQEISNYQRFVGELTRDLFAQQFQTTNYLASADSEKVSEIVKIMTDANTTAKIILFDHTPKRSSKRVKTLVGQKRSEQSGI